MNFAGKPGSTASGLFSASHIGAVELPHHSHAGAITVSDPYLLFSGDYKRSGPDLILSKDGREHIVENYFVGEKRAALAAPDGAQLSGDIVSALTGHVQYAQASGAVDAGKVIGHVTKLAGNATVIRNGVSIVLNMGDNVHKGDVVQSGSNSSLGITFIDGTVFGLASNARMVLNEMVYDPNGSSNSSFLTLVQGTITFLAGETAKHGDMKVGTPVATMGIRGTACQVEIGFDVQVTDPNSTTPLSIPVKFRVLQEKDGTVGSYLLFAPDDLTFSNPIATINHAGQVTSFNANGQITVSELALIAPEVKQITDFVLGLSSGNNPTPGSGVTPDSGTPKDTTPLKDIPVGTPTPLEVPINFQDPNHPGQTIHETVNVTVTVLKKVDVVPVVDKSGFVIAEQVTITDSDPSDVLTPYVPGSGSVLSASAPAYAPAGVDLRNFVTVDPSTGHVSYDPAGFAFLKAGDKAVITIGFDSGAGTEIFHESLTITINGVNDAPAIDHATLAVPEGGTVVLTAANIGVTDPDSTAFTFTVSAVTHGTFQVSADGVTWSDAATFTTADLNAGHVRFVHDGGEDAPTFSIKADDGEAANNLSSVVAGIVDFSNVNDAPTVTKAFFSVLEGGTVVLDAASIGVTDPDSKAFTFTVSGVTHGAFQVSANGVTWSDAATFTTADLDAGHVRFVHDGGEDAPTFSIRADDGEAANNLSNELVGTVDFSNVNDAPAVTIAVFAVSEGGTVLLDAASIGVTDPDNTSFTFTVSNVSHGTFQTTADGTTWVDAGAFTTAELNAGHVRFVHDGGEDAPTFSIQADDGAGFDSLSNVLAGTVNFTNVNDAPVIDTATLVVSEGGTVVLASTDIGVTDPDSTSFTFTVSTVSHGTFQISTDGATWTDTHVFTTAELNDGHVRFVHDGGEDAPAFSIQADDGAAVNNLSNVVAGTVDFTNVNDAPVVTSATLTIAEGGTVVLSTANIGVSDPDDSSFVFVALDVSHGTFQTTTDGTIWVEAGTFSTDDLNAGHVRFVHDGGEDAPTFSIQAYDSAGGDNLSNVLAGTVDFTNVNDAPVVTSATLTIAEGDTVVLSAKDIGVTDPDSANFTFTASNVSHGTFQTTTNGITWTAATTFTTADLSAGHVRFVHDGGEDAPTFSIQADDGADTNSLSNVFAGTVNFTNVNDAPIVTSAVLTVLEGGTAVLNASNIGVTDPDSTSFAFTASNVSHGTFQTTTNGTTWVAATTFTTADLNANHVRFVHDGGEDAPTFSIQADDGAGVNSLSNVFAGTVNFTNVNDAPVATAPSVHYSATEQTDLSLRNTGLSVSDVDGNGGNETVTLAAGEGIITIAAGDSGVSNIGGNGSSSVTFSGSIAQINALLNTSTGTIVYNDNTDTPGASTALTLTVHDNGHSGSGGDLAGSASSTIDITAVNDAPVIAGGDFASISVPENTTTAVETVVAVDPDNPTLNYSIVYGFGSPDASSFTIDSATGALLFARAPDFEHPTDSNHNNIYTVQVKASDGSLSDTQTLFVHVTDVNEAPHAVNDVVITNNVNNSTYEIPDWALLANDTDPDGNALTVSSISHPSGFSSAVLSDGDVTIHDDSSVGGSFTYTASDGSLTDTGNVTVTQDVGTMNGGSGNEIFIGDSNGSTINANGGNDILIGNGGDDVLNGGSGNDTYVFGLHDGNDVIHDTSGLDTIRIEAGGAALSGLGFAENPFHDLVIKFDGQQITVDDHFIGDDNVGGLQFDGGASYDGYSLGSDLYFVSNDGGFNRAGTPGNDILSGDGNANSLSGGDGNDLLFGNAGNDTLSGGSGNDLLVGGSGNDFMTGGPGNDTFVFAKGSGHDTVADFTPGQDHISLDYAAFNASQPNGFSNWLTSHAAPANGDHDVLIDLNVDGLHPGVDTILLKNVTIASLHAGDFIVHPVT